MKEKPSTEERLWNKLKLIDLRISVIEERRTQLYGMRERIQAQLIAEQNKNRVVV